MILKEKLVYYFFLLIALLVSFQFLFLQLILRYLFIIIIIIILYNSNQLINIFYNLGGVISLLIIADTKIKAMECAVQVLSFVSKNFGKAEPRDQVKDWASLANILKSLKSTLKKEMIRANESNDRIDRKF